MEHSGYLNTEQANTLLDAMLTGLQQLRTFCYITGDDLIGVARKVETLDRQLFDVQIRVAEEIHTQNLAGTRAYTSTASLLRDALNIVPAQANTRLRNAKKLLPQSLPTGGHTPPVLPALAAAVAAGAVDGEHVRVIINFNNDLPGKVETSLREQAEKF